MGRIITDCYFKSRTQSYFVAVDNPSMRQIPITGPHRGFAERLREALQEARPEPIKISQPTVGKFAGVSPITARNWLTGQKLPGMAKAVALSESLGVCVEWLLTGRGPKRPQTALEGEAAEIAEEWRSYNEYQKAAIRAIRHTYRRPA